jgi:hypothetical protein
LVSAASLSLTSVSRASRDQFPPFPIGPDHLAVRLSRSPKKCFLPNEPKVVQCLPHFLKNKVLTNRIKTVSKPI